MKNIVLYTLGIMVLGIVGLSGISADAASVPDNWSQKLKCENSCPRFKVLKAWDNAVVLDQETGLVWEQSPATQSNFISANIHCIELEVSQRLGWRLPTLQELTSLIDKSQDSPALPSGHPFNIGNNIFWSATKHGTDRAWRVNLVAGGMVADLQTESYFVWCVRGRGGADDQ